MKYELTENFKEIWGEKVFQIRAVKDFKGVKKGDLGGWIAGEKKKSVVKRDDRYFSEYDQTLEYKIGEVKECLDFDPNPEVSCGPGIHASHLHYWDERRKTADSYLKLEIQLSDIITCLEGKVRCKKGMVLGEVLS